MNTLEELASCRFDLTHIILNKKHLDVNTLNEVKTKLLLIKSLSEKVRKNSNFDCSESLIEVQECVARIK